MSYNRVIMLCNLTADPDLRFAPSGSAVTDLRVAMNEKYKNQSGEWVERPIYVDVTVWGRQAETCNEYLSKGRQVLIEGRLRYDSWETPEGQKRSKLRVTAERVQFVGSRPDGAGGGSSRSPTPSSAASSPASSRAAAPSSSSPPPADAPKPTPAPPAPEPSSAQFEEEEKDDLPF